MSVELESSDDYIHLTTTWCRLVCIWMVDRWLLTLQPWPPLALGHSNVPHCLGLAPNFQGGGFIQPVFQQCHGRVLGTEGQLLFVGQNHHRHFSAVANLARNCCTIALAERRPFAAYAEPTGCAWEASPRACWHIEEHGAVLQWRDPIDPQSQQKSPIWACCISSIPPTREAVFDDNIMTFVQGPPEALSSTETSATITSEIILEIRRYPGEL